MAYDLLTYLQDCRDSNSDPDDAVYDACCVVDTDTLQRLRLRIEQLRNLKVKGNSKAARSFRGKQSRHLGLMLERLMLHLLRGCNVLTVSTNVRSTMAEIDYLVVLKLTAAVFPMFRDAGSHSLGEAKCVAGSLKTEWVNELAGLLPAHGSRLGILFTSAPSKKLVPSCRMALAVHAARGFHIVPFGFKQLNEVISGKSFLKVLAEQYVSVMSSSTDLEI